MKLHSDTIFITETPRDALQGWPSIIPTIKKANYINTLLKAGFDMVDVGSFVSPKAVPQMADTADLISQLDAKNSQSRIMVIAGNTRGGLEAARHQSIDVIGYPFSVSPTFLKLNLNTTPVRAIETIHELQAVCTASGKELQVYLAMAFGNPYNDDWSEELVLDEAKKLQDIGINRLAFSDITGQGTADTINSLCSKLTSLFSPQNLSIHLHTQSNDWLPKVEAAWEAGFRHFEGAIGGYGGCPMIGFELVGNLNTASLYEWCNKKKIKTSLKPEFLTIAMKETKKIFV